MGRPKKRALARSLRDLTPVREMGQGRGGCLAAFERRRFVAQQLSNGRNVSGSWAVTDTLNDCYEPKDHSIAACYGYIEEAIANPRGYCCADD